MRNKLKIKMKPEVQLISYFLKNRTTSLSIRELSINTGINYRITYEKVNELSESGILELEKKGNMTLCKFSYKYHPKLALIEELRAVEIIEKQPEIGLIDDVIERIKNPFFIFLIFGSYSKEKIQKTSDIDLCLICDDKKLEKEIIDKLNMLSIDLDMQTFTTKEFLELLSSSKRNLGHEIKENNIILKGIESFYELINYE